MSKRLPLFVGLGAVGVILLVLLFLVMPRISAVKDANATLAAGQTKEQQLREQVKQLEQLRTNAGTIQRELNKNQLLIPPQADKPGLIRLLQLEADKTGVDLQAIQPGSATLGSSGDFSVIPVNVTVTGTFFQEDEFLFGLENLPRAIKVTAVNVSSSAWPTLNMGITAETYTTDISAGPGSTPGHQDASSSTSTTAPAPAA